MPIGVLLTMPLPVGGEPLEPSGINSGRSFFPCPRGADTFGQLAEGSHLADHIGLQICRPIEFFPCPRGVNLFGNSDMLSPILPPPAWGPRGVLLSQEIEQAFFPRPRGVDV